MSDLIVDCMIGFVAGWFGRQIFLFIKDYYRKKYYRTIYTVRDVREFITKFPRGNFCPSTYEPDPEMAYNVYGETPMTKKELQIWLNKLEYDELIICSYFNKEKTCTIISERKAKLLEEIYRPWPYRLWTNIPGLCK